MIVPAQGMRRAASERDSTEIFGSTRLSGEETAPERRDDGGLGPPDPAGVEQHSQAVVVE